jgi:Sporulation and spore germination/Putative peptidoglycan binding domain
VKVWFLRGEQLKSVNRPGTTADEAVRHLLAGPTEAEEKRGVRSHVPPGTPVRSVAVDGRVATVDLGHEFVDSADGESLRARLTQLVYTLSGPQGANEVRLLVDGKTPPDVFPGVSAAGPVTVEYLETPDVEPAEPPEPPSLRAARAQTSIRAAQERLAELGYLLPGDVDGRPGPATQNAILASRSGRASSVTVFSARRRAHASRPLSARDRSVGEVPENGRRCSSTGRWLS